MRNMKKILIAFDGAHFSDAAFDFARQLNEQQPLLLGGLFLPSADYRSMIAYYLGGFDVPFYFPTSDVDADDIERNISRFRELCRKHHIEHRVHNLIAGSIVEGIAKETRYADLLLISSGLFYSNMSKGAQREYLHDTVHDAECPVIILPEQYHFPKSLVLAYDGSESAVFAIRQFAYLFPEFASLSTTIVYASEKDGELPDLAYIKELAARHFPDLTFFKLEADPKKYFDTWVESLRAPLIVAGSLGRSGFSEVFKKSFIRDVIAAGRQPVFIAHK